MSYRVHIHTSQVIFLIIMFTANYYINFFPHQKLLFMAYLMVQNSKSMSCIVKLIVQLTQHAKSQKDRAFQFLSLFPLLHRRLKERKKTKHKITLHLLQTNSYLRLSKKQTHLTSSRNSLYQRHCMLTHTPKKKKKKTMMGVHNTTKAWKNV